MSYRAMFAPLLAMASGCATIVGEPTQLVPINSTPSDASVVVTDERGTEVFKGKTPTTVTLAKSDGSYWGGKSYTAVLSRDGYSTQRVPIESSPNFWYLGGNFFFGSFIGWFAVDPFFGDMYTLSPGEVRATLGSETSDLGMIEGGVSVVLLERPGPYRDEFIRVHRGAHGRRH